MNTPALFFVVSLLAVISATTAILGGYKPIGDLHDPHVQEVAMFAVTEENMITNTRLEYVGIIKGEKQVANVTNYRLVISAKDRLRGCGRGVVRNYVAVVYEKPSAPTWASLHSPKLISMHARMHIMVDVIIIM
ncbi:hypothetical protein vseg_011624 [Gypsophila vaccaria]